MLHVYFDAVLPSFFCCGPAVCWLQSPLLAVQDGALAASVAHRHHRRHRLSLPGLRLPAGQQAVVQLQPVGRKL